MATVSHGRQLVPLARHGAVGLSQVCPKRRSRTRPPRGATDYGTATDVTFTGAPGLTAMSSVLEQSKAMGLGQ